ncbi:Xaa-Pro peptidase family protein [Pseudooceanicola sp. CBS1P-1]|uniref:M24 family metallopeptidase n=1 Tax=Pseudooceanicola albus TaxID=2692189 RepID=A0A6L7G609_9RHOB|nr:MULTISPECIES: Xaa-Pro peptidase family protein [Pseudooceanicola]MBT9385315.1 Xaa-Pro peptidase family protein [Pseudooceanicola endophyticus]MXN18826.1 M24 family metallopeptidase [Pseudooceanicola albus]
MNQTRLSNLRAAMAASDTDLVAIGPGSHMLYLLGYNPHGDERPCLLLVSGGGAVMLMPQLNAASAREHTDVPFCEWADAEGPVEALRAALESIGADTAASVVLDETMRADFAFLVMDHLPQGCRRRFTEDTLGALRARKDAEEYALLKASALINDAAFETAVAALKPGMSELELGAIIEAHYAENGATVAFCIIGGAGNGAFPHHHTGHRPLQAGDAIVVDIGCIKDGYPSDMTRMMVLGDKPEGYDEVHAVVEAAVQAALAAAKPGARARDVDAAARGVIEAAGYGPNFLHRTGHGLGVDVHEPPYITSVNDTVLEEGMVFSIEPGIYLEGRFGVRLEDIVILRADGPEILSSLPRSLARVPT